MLNYRDRRRIAAEEAERARFGRATEKGPIPPRRWGVITPLLISLLSLGITSAGFYFQWFWQSSKLSGVLGNVEVISDQTGNLALRGGSYTVSISITLMNQGSRPVLLQGAQLLIREANWKPQSAPLVSNSVDDNLTQRLPFVFDRIGRKRTTFNIQAITTETESHRPFTPFLIQPLQVSSIILRFEKVEPLIVLRASWRQEDLKAQSQSDKEDLLDTRVGVNSSLIIQMLDFSGNLHKTIICPGNGIIYEDGRWSGISASITVLPNILQNPSYKAESLLSASNVDPTNAIFGPCDVDMYVAHQTSRAERIRTREVMREDFRALMRSRTFPIRRDE